MPVIFKRYIKNWHTLILGFCSFKYLPAPVTVPPVPIAEIKASILPFEPFHISGPVVS